MSNNVVRALHTKVKVEDTQEIDSHESVANSETIQLSQNQEPKDIRLLPLSTNLTNLNDRSSGYNYDQSEPYQSFTVREESNEELILSKAMFEERRPCSTANFCVEERLLTFKSEEKSQCDDITTSQKSIATIPFVCSSIVPMMDNTKQSCSTPMRTTESLSGLEINCNNNTSEDQNQSEKNSDPASRQSHHVHHHVQPNHMPPLCCNTISTPSLSIQFSPFLSFSEDRVTNSLMLPNQVIDIAPATEEENRTNCIEGNEEYETDDTNNVNSKDDGSFCTSTLALSATSSGPSAYSKPELTYADSLLLNASQGRRQYFSTPIPKQPDLTPKISEKKRKANNQCRSSRQPQKRFSIDVDRNEIPGGDLFVSKRDGRIRLTTNLPRKVEAIDVITGRRSHLYASCSEASRIMGINRTRMSRSKSGLFYINIF
jgi:hypothetical protein